MDSPAAELTIAVSPSMAPTLSRLAEQFNAQTRETPDGSLMLVRTVSMVPEKMIEESLDRPTFQAIAPDSSLWLNQLDRRWSEEQGEALANEETIIPIGNRRFNNPTRYATSPVVIAAWEEVARDLGWPDQRSAGRTFSARRRRIPTSSGIIPAPDTPAACWRPWPSSTPASA